MDSKKLFRDRLNHEVKTRAYYSKYIFNSHFLLFLTITLGVFVYSLFGYLQTIEPNIYLVIVSAVLTGLFVLPGHRSLLKTADGLFLLSYEQHMRKYFQNTDRFSLSLGIIAFIFALLLSTILLSVGHGWLEIIMFYSVALILYVVNYHIRKRALNTDLSRLLIGILLYILSVGMLIITLIYPLVLPLGALLYFFMFVWIKKSQFAHLNWHKLIKHEKEKEAAYFRTVSMFANVSNMDSQYKRRGYLDFLLPTFRGKSFNKEKMYEYLFFRSFARDNDLPMIILRLLIICIVVMFWLDIWYVSLLVSMFFLYLIVLQMSQIYSQQAYLLWPKIWPVKREYIQKSYIRYSHKLIVVIGVVLALAFIGIHLDFFYVGFVLPLWGLLLNQVFSKSIYKKERALSD